MSRTPEAFRGSASQEQERSPLDELRRDVSSTREAFAKQKNSEAMTRKMAKGADRKESGSMSSPEKAAYEEKLRAYRKGLLEASKSETDPKKKAALLREAVIDTTVKEVDELWGAQRRAKIEARGGPAAWEQVAKIANSTVEFYRHLSWKKKLAISGALFAAASTGAAPVMLGATVGLAAQRVLSAGAAAMGTDALIKRFGIDRSRINEILGAEIRKEKDPAALAEKLSTLLQDENNELNEQMLGMGGRKSGEVLLRGATGAAIFGSMLLGLPAKAIGKGVEHVAGDQIKVVRSAAGQAVHKMAGWLHLGGVAEASIPPGGAGAIPRGGVLATEETLALEKIRAGVRNRMAFNEGYGAEDQTARMKMQTEKGIRNRMNFNEGYGPEDQLEQTRSRLKTEKGIENRKAFDEGYGQEEQRVQSGIHTKKGIDNRMAFDEGHGQEEQRIRSRFKTEKGIENRIAFNEGYGEKNVSPNLDQFAFHLEKGGSVEGSLNKYLKVHAEDIKANPQLQKALGWDGDPKKIGGASHRLWLKMVNDVAHDPDTAAHKKLIEQLEKAGFHVKDAIKDTQHPERLVKIFDAAARRMPIGMDFTVNPQTGVMEFSDPHFGKATSGIHEPTHGHSLRLQEMQDEKHWQETRESMARLKEHIDELKQSTQDAVDRAADAQEIQHLEKRAELSARGDIEQAAQVLKRGDSQLQKIGFVARERSAWLADKTTRVQDVLRQIPPDYDLGRGGAGNDINLPHQKEYRWGAVVRQMKLAKHLREAIAQAHLRFDEAGIPKNAAVRDMTIGQFLSKVNPQTGVFENTR